MSRLLPLLAPILLAVLAGLAVPASASADFGNAADAADGAQLISADYGRLEQGDDATDYAAISADGHFVAIQTTARNFFADDDPDPPGLYRAGGIFRVDLETKMLEKVADGSLYDEAGGVFQRSGAGAPSISADGRFVAFTTNQRLIAADANDNSDVYVRDMEKGAGEAGAFDLVSARDGGDEPAHYGGALSGNLSGSEASRGVAISADGQRVVFRTEVVSDLPASASADVPAGQLFVRDRALETTTLVSAKRDPESGAMTATPAGGAGGASISADGSTVAWIGTNAATQTRLFSGENDDPAYEYLLWRRVDGGPTAPTRRITGVADPDDPACNPASVPFFDQSSTGPCYGPLTDQEASRSSIGSLLPALSADGRKVAFLTVSSLRPLVAGSALDLFVTDMSAGVSRKQGTVELTRDVPGDPTSSPPINGIAMSSSGRYISLVTARSRFSHPALRLVGSPPTTPGKRELYVVDLTAGTIERATHSFGGGDIDGDVVNSTTISADGSRVAFASFAANLFFGDANRRTDAFVATRRPDPEGRPDDGGPGGGGGGGTIETDPGGPTIAARAKSKPGGVVQVTVSVPAAGGVKALARARVGEPRTPRTLATASGRAQGTTRSSVILLLRPVERYREELRERGAIPGRMQVSYVASRGGRHASASIAFTFRQRPGAKRGRR